MSVELDSELVNVFLVEAGELLDRLGEQLVELETMPGDTELLNAVFRAFHTVKGGAGFLGFDPMVALCHRAEDLLNQARNHTLLLNSAHMDALLESLDLLNDMMRACDAGETLREAPASLLRRLESQQDVDAVSVPEPVAGAVAGPCADPVCVDPIDDEFEALIAAARVGRGHEAAVALVPAKPVSATGDAPIGDDEFEALLDSLYGAGGAPGTVEAIADAAPAPVMPAAKAPSSTAIDDDEFEAMLDALHGTGKGPGSVAPAAGAVSPAATAAPVDAATPARAAVTPAASTPARSTATADSTVRVDTARLDGLVNAAGELVLVRNRLSMLAGGGQGEAMNRAVAELERVAADLQNAVLRMRMQPIGKLFQRFPRIVRDLARQLGKDIELKTEGEETDLDRTVVEALADPLIHLLRNAVDHGIEDPADRTRLKKRAQGTVRLAAAQVGDRIIITVADDGRGMDPEVLRRKAVEKGLLDEEQAARLDTTECFELIFRPGFSTRAQVSDISGRGVGMDVVKTKIVELGGTLAIDSLAGRGSEIRLSVPLTLAILRVLMVRVGNRRLALPLSNIAEVFELVAGQVSVVDGRVVASHRGRALPLCDLAQWANAPIGGRHVVVVHIGSQRVGCLVDDVLGREDVMAKPLGSLLKDVPGIAGATITGDGAIALVLDLSSLADGSQSWLPAPRGLT
ncbi:chemotaxis protein CheA [Pinirhizobacter sp.]|jgi:two-component system chemotaxis sensor kinase CheA|uniref:chemotaxis protein CheA n=1 Tax=Pinirhizobacter sp. TaxID=2950432 RepID=UPI002F3F7531